MLVLPDYLGYDSIISMLSKHRQIVERVLKMKTIINRITAAVGGQPLHPRTLIVGGFTKVPERETLVKLAQELKRIKEDALETVYFFSKLSLPEFNRRAIHIALRNNSEYPVNEGKLVSTEGLNIEETEYREHFREIQVPWANAKYSVVTDTIPFAVGALARLNLNFDLLSPDAKNIAKEVDYQIPNFNPFSISKAQAIEIVNGIDICLELLNKLRPKMEKISYKVRAGEGSAITEAPRGSLYHSYRINRDGKVERADIVTPTAHNAFNIEKDLRALLPRVSYMEEEKLTLICENLIRSYDPCFSCSVHIIKE
jgi:coenzyme F420-reducing hydrogenase alpha subunit